VRIARILFGLLLTCNAAAQLPYQNPSLPTPARVTDLLARMTPDEKFRQLFMVVGDLSPDSTRFTNGLFGFQVDRMQPTGDANQQLIAGALGSDARRLLEKVNGTQRFFVVRTRLGIPMLAYEEALHGVVQNDGTMFPQSIAMAASFDTTLMRKVSEAIALETKARGIRMVLSPVVNLATDVRWGRVEETYGEDPYLASLMGSTYVKAFESRGIITTPKHFVANHGDGGRDSYPAFHSERLLREIYFKPFKACIQQGGARSIMTAYNSLNGRPCSSNSWLLNDVLRTDWGFRGFVISDAAATGGANVLHYTARDYEDAGRQSVENGQDVIFQTDIAHYALFKKPFLNGTVRQSAIDSAVANVLRMKFELGLFDEPYQSDSLLNALDLKKHRELAYEMAVKSAVLLKNEGYTLPIPSFTKRIAVIGSEAVEARLGGYSGPGQSPMSILDGLRQRLNGKAEVVHAPGPGRTTDQFQAVPAKVLFHRNGNELEHGLRGRYFSGIDITAQPTLTRIDERVAFDWTLYGPAPSIPYDHFGVIWEGVILPDKDYYCELGVRGNDGYRLYLNGELLIDRWNEQTSTTTGEYVELTAGKAVELLIEYRERTGNARFDLVWDTGESLARAQMIEDAKQLAESCEFIVAVVGIEEGEFRDRSDLELPGHQEWLISALIGTGLPVAVVVVGGSAFTMENWDRNVGAVLMAWYPGEAGGLAIADLLLGTRNPSGRLPITFPRNEGQLPLNYNHFPTGRGDDYVDGTGHPLFPFGYGLSYSSFAYSDLKLSSTKFRSLYAMVISFQLTNTGSVAGEEVVQLYTHDELASVARPVKELKGFQRVSLAAGETKSVSFWLTADMLMMFNQAMEEVTEPGMFRVMIGGSSKDIRLRAMVEFTE